MAIALAPRVYGLDAICAAALQTGGDESGPVRPPPLRARRRQGPGGGAGRAARRGRRLPARLRPPPPARRRQGPGVQSDRRRPRLREPPHDRADRQRRHAVPGRFDHQRVQSPRDRRPSAGPSRDGGAARPRRRPSGHRGRGRRAGAVRIDDAYRDRPPGRSARRSTNSPPPSPACWPRCGWRSRTGGRCGAPASTPSPISRPAIRPTSPSTTISCAGWKPIISPSSAIAATAMSTMPRSRAACATS